MTPYRISLIVLFAGLLAWSAINPLSYADWILEILPIAAAVPLLFFFGKRWGLSDISYTLIFVLMAFPVMSAHYGVTHVPIGETLGRWLDTDRNMFDRMIHFSFGLLATYPFIEIFRNRVTKKGFASLMAFTTVMTLSAAYEVFEWGVHEVSWPAFSTIFIGAQADFWDTPKDMALAGLGSLIALLIVWIASKRNTRAA